MIDIKLVDGTVIGAQGINHTLEGWIATTEGEKPGDRRVVTYLIPEGQIRYIKSTSERSILSKPGDLN